MKLEGKNIWITGASSGIGKAVALEISKQKTFMVLSGRNEESLKKVAEICQKNGSTVKIIPFDLGVEKSVIQAAQKIFSEKIKIDGLYHFGGISQRSFVSETPLEVDRKIFEVNFFGTVALTKAILPWMIENGGGQIAVTSSIAGKFGFPFRSAYSASKHALHGYFESLRAENVQNNIRVSFIIPGRIKTNVSLNALNKNGNPHGQMDEGLDKGKSADWTARKICRSLQNERKEILVGGAELIMVYIRRFFPRLYYFMASRVKPL
jgi:dehydrogenase/reductase SDR family member 7B